MALNLSKLGPVDPGVEHVVQLTDQILKTRRKIEAEAISWTEASPQIVTQLEAMQAALFAELHQAMNDLEARLR